MYPDISSQGKIAATQIWITVSSQICSKILLTSGNRQPPKLVSQFGANFYLKIAYCDHAHKYNITRHITVEKVCFATVCGGFPLRLNVKVQKCQMNWKIRLWSRLERLWAWLKVSGDHRNQPICYLQMYFIPSHCRYLQHFLIYIIFLCLRVVSTCSLKFVFSSM